ncbi:MAG: PpiC-type peptidyl-prolyl cis-trans isomerase [Acidobacteria bacterium]|nr:PpiC-type peptidyl-prolyl cis-trans isomerase [Acidobacteriota bacterium]
MPIRPARRQALLLLAMFCGHAASSRSQQATEPAAASDPQQRIVVSVNGEPLTAADVEKVLQSLPIQSRDYYSHEGRQLLPQYLVRMQVLAQEARRQKLGEKQEIRDAIRIATESILADAAHKLIAQGIAVPQDQLLQLYQSRANQYEEVRIRRILIRTETSILSQSSVPSRPPLASADARKKMEELRQQILDGADFAALAQTNSDDLASAAAGGDLGFVSYRSVIPPIAQAAAALNPGGVSEVIPTPFGMELIQVVEKRTKPLEEVRPELEAILRQGTLEDKLQDLANKSKVFVDSKFFEPQASAPAPASLPSSTGSAGSAPPGR